MAGTIENRKAVSRLRITALLVVCLLVTTISAAVAITRPAPPTISKSTAGIEIVNLPKGNITSLSLKPDSSEIAFSIDAADEGRLWIANVPSFLHASLIASVSQQVTNIEWSHNGEDLLYVAATAGSASIYVVKLSDYQSKKIISLNGIESAHWSLDDSMIVFSGLSDAGWNVYRVNTQTWNTKQLTSSGNDEYTSWCPNGSSVLFSRIQNDTSSIMVISTNTGSSTTVANYSGTDIWPIENVNGTLAFESNASGSWTVMTDQDGTMTDILRTAAYYTGIPSPAIDPRWGPIWASQGNQMFFVGDLNNKLNSYVVNFSGAVLAPADLTMPIDQQLYQTWIMYHLAVVNQVASKSNLTLIAFAWDGTTQSLFAIVPESGHVALVQVGSSGIVSYPNPYDTNP